MGSGFAAAFHYRALQHVVSAKVEVAGVYSADKAGMESFAKERGIPTFDSLDALIDAAIAGAERITVNASQSRRQ